MSCNCKCIPNCKCKETLTLCNGIENLGGSGVNSMVSPNCEMIRIGCDGHTIYVENVNHPPHYQGNCLEVIDIIEDFNLNFCLGNAIKYILRAGKKDSSKQDLMKAIWYLQREIGDDNI